MKGRRYFYVAAFNQMRNLLIDRARKRKPMPVADTGLAPLDLIVESIEEQNGHDLESLDLANCDMHYRLQEHALERDGHVECEFVVHLEALASALGR